MNEGGNGIQQPKRVRWGLILVLAVIVFVILGGILVVVGFAALMKGRQVSVEPDSTLVLNLDRPLQETPPDPLLTQLFHKKVYSVFEVTRAIDKAAADRRIKNLLLNIGSFHSGFGQIQDLRGAVKRFEKSGKPVWAYFEATGNGGYYLASAADKVYAPPTAYLALSGLAVEMPFYRGIFDKLRIEPQLYHIGKYKSYSDMFMLKDMSKAQREATNAILDSLYGQLVSGIAEGRKLTSDEVKKDIDNGFLRGSQLTKLRLVDGLLYSDQVEDALKRANGNRQRWRYITLGNYAKDRRFSFSPGAGNAIGLVVASGGIVGGEGEGSSVAMGKNLGAASAIKWLREVGRDNSIKAVVLRVNSPGGSGLASDLIWRQVEVLKKSKPVVVSMSNVAGSGGYYIAMGANAIVAEPGTITGSIGVISGKFVLKGLLDWAGYNQVTLKRGANADMMSAYHPFTPAQETIIKAQMAAFYKDFVSKAAQGRHMTFKQIDAIGRGRIWSGEDALKIGLVDKLGGIDTAIALAKEKAGISKTAKVRIKLYPRPKTIFESLFNTDLNDLSRARALSNLPPQFLQAYEDYERLAPLNSDPVALITPIRIKM